MSNRHVLQVELTKNKIQSLQKELNSKNSAFLNKNYLESLGSPNSIIGRENEVRQILKLLDCQDNYFSPVVSVYGRSGSGKSSVVKFLCENLSNSFSSSYVNLRKARTIFGCANLILTQLDANPVKSHEGISLAIDKIQFQIGETLNRDRKKQFVLILDEFDVIFSDLRGHPSDFVFKLLTIVENLRSDGFSLCIIPISNSSLFDYSLDDRVKSRMDKCEVFFAPYNKKEILSILKERSKKAFCKKIDDKVLGLCADLSSFEHGDCRRALQLLRLAGELAQSKKLSKEHVEKAYENLDDDKIDSILNTATPHQRFLLAALAYLVLHSEKEFHSTKEIFVQYSYLCVTYPRLSYRRIYDLLVELENTGIIQSKTHSQGRHGYHNFFKFTVDYRLVGYMLSKEWWNDEMNSKEKQQVLDSLVEYELNPTKSEKQKLAFARAFRRYSARFSNNN